MNRIKHAYTQNELAAAIDSGHSILVAYRSSGSLKWSHGNQAIICVPHLRKVSGLPFTLRGRTQLVTPELFDKMNNA
jgi:hypothetical protein